MKKTFKASLGETTYELEPGSANACIVRRNAEGETRFYFAQDLLEQYAEARLDLAVAALVSDMLRKTRGR